MTALNLIHPEEHVLISSAPAQHFSQIMKSLALSFDVLVEKPFVSVEDAQAAMDLAKKKGAFWLKLSCLNILDYGRAIEYWNKNKLSIKKIKLEYSIPELPPHTFRDDKEIINSILFDIGCYGLTLLFDFGLSLKHLKLKDLDFKGGELLRLKLSSDQNPNVELIFSIVDKYKNYLKFEKGKNEVVSFEPFFYGRKGQRKIVYSNNHKIFDETITFEGNSFCNMLETSI